MKMNLRRALPLLLLLPLLAGCIIVKDFGKIWEQASGDICLNRITEALFYQVHTREIAADQIDTVARGTTLDGHNYILLKESAGDKGGFLYKFTVKEGVFTRYKLNPAMRKTFLKENPDTDVSFYLDTVRIDSFSPENLALLNKIAGDDRYWEPDDKTLYNTQLNPLCRFEDRDLSKMER